MALTERLRNWAEQVGRDIRKRWWWPFLGIPVTFIWELGKDRVLTATNHFIDAHANLDWLKPLALLLQNHGFVPAVLLAFTFAFLVLLGLVVHAYFETRPSKHTAAPNAPFLTLHFPEPDLMSSGIRTDYAFIKNIGQRTALDVQVAELSHQWRRLYRAEFPRLQMLEPNQSVPITPEVYCDGQHEQRFSINSRVWFCELLASDATAIPFGTETSHKVSMSYTDQGTKRSNSVVIVARWTPGGPLVSVRDQK